MRAPVLIRHPKDEESLHEVFPGLGAYYWNPEQVWVAEVEGELAGGLIEWDGGHDIVHLSNLTVREAYRTRGVGLRLLEHVRDDLRSRGKKRILGETNSIEMAYWAKKRGATVGGPTFLLGWIP